MLRIVVPLGVIALVAAWFLNYRSPGTGGVRVTTSVPGADIFIAGTMTAFQTDTTLRNVPVGRQIVTVRKQGFVSEPELAVVEVKRGRLSTASFELRDERTLAREDSIPPLRSVRQEIFSTGEPVLPVPPSRFYPPSRRLIDYSSRLTERSRAPAISADPFASVPEQASSETGFRERSSAAGSPVLPVTQVTVSSVPDGAQITVNGNLTQRVTPYTFRGLDYGTYVFRISKPGYVCKPESIRVVLSEEGEADLASFSLTVDQELPRPMLTVQTTPPAAGVRVNGRQAGVGRVAVELPFGKHTVEFGDVPGYRTPAPVAVEVTTDDPHPEVKGTYERLTGNSFLAILPSEEVGAKFDGSKLRIFVDNELLLDGPKQPFNVTLMGKIPAGKRLVRVQYDDLIDDIHVNLQDGEVSEVTFRIESFFSKRRLRLRERESMPLERWEQKSRRLSVLNAS